MKRKIRVNPIARIAHIPQELIAEGFSGDLDAYADALTLTLVKPGVAPDKIVVSLKLVIKDLELRMSMPESAKER